MTEVAGAPEEDVGEALVPLPRPKKTNSPFLSFIYLDSLVNFNLKKIFPAKRNSLPPSIMCFVITFILV